MFSLCVTLMFSVRSEIVITRVGMNSLCNFTKYYSCEISLNVNFDIYFFNFFGLFFFFCLSAQSPVMYIDDNTPNPL